MAAYPSLPITASSSSTRLDGFVSLRASNGALKVRKMMSGEKMEWTVQHELTASQKATLESFYQSNKTSDVDFTWPGDGNTYTARFIGAPLYVAQPGGWYRATVRLAEV